LLLVAVAFQLIVLRRVSAAKSLPSAVVKLTALLSLALWFGVGIAGRAIGYL
jgi:hypothetical protein